MINKIKLTRSQIFKLNEIVDHFYEIDDFTVITGSDSGVSICFDLFPAETELDEADKKHKAVPIDEADRITVDTLIESRRCLQKELDHHKNGGWLHEDDVVGNKVLIDASTQLIEYYGGE
jgi:hypothetical protein